VRVLKNNNNFTYYYFTIRLIGQIQLDVEGDAKIQGKLDLKMTFGFGWAVF